MTIQKKYLISGVALLAIGIFYAPFAVIGGVLIIYGKLDTFTPQ